MGKIVKMTESQLHRIIKESVQQILKEARQKATPRQYNIDGVDYESTNKIRGGGAWHPGFRFKDHESHNPNKLKSFRKRKDGYRYADSYAGRPDDLHKYLTSESIDKDYNRDMMEKVRGLKEILSSNDIDCSIKSTQGGAPYIYVTDIMADMESHQKAIQAEKLAYQYDENVRIKHYPVCIQIFAS